MCCIIVEIEYTYTFVLRQEKPQSLLGFDVNAFTDERPGCADDVGDGHRLSWEVFCIPKLQLTAMFPEAAAG